MVYANDVLANSLTLLFSGPIDTENAERWQEELLSAEINYHMLHDRYEAELEHIQNLQEAMLDLDEQIEDLTPGDAEHTSLLYRRTELQEQASAVEAEMVEPPETISIYLNTEGGDIDLGFSMLDLLDNLSAPVTVVACGRVYSMGIYLLITADQRLAMPHTKFLIHPSETELAGRNSDVRAAIDVIDQDMDRLMGLFAKQTGRDPKEIEEDHDRDTWLTASEAKSYGIVDGIVGVDTIRET